ncbi:MAG: DUF4142 domain-containing protein [Bacteroidota bacterium]|nr:DUF4142 domain-containing protein [Bacteroidota bacterium]
MNKLLFFIFALIATVGGSIAFVACDDANSNNEDSVENAQDINKEKDIEKDKSNFMTKAASSGMFEVKVGEWAAQKGSTPVVKTFGAQMVADHSKANAELQALGQSENVTLPGDMGKDYQDKYDDLAKKSGKDFDEAYMDLMKKEHKNDVDMYEDYAEDEDSDMEVRAFAQKYLPILKSHHTKAESGEEHTDKAH